MIRQRRAAALHLLMRGDNARGLYLPEYEISNEYYSTMKKFLFFSFFLVTVFSWGLLGS